MVHEDALRHMVNTYDVLHMRISSTCMFCAWQLRDQLA